MGAYAVPTAHDVAASAPVRDAYIDNIKAVLIVLVVLGHTVEKVAIDAPGATTIYTWIYFFHMPAFAVLSGMLTSHVSLDGRKARAMVAALLVPLAIFQLLYLGLYSLNHRGTGWNVDALLTPLYQLWFLAALFVWRWCTPILLRLRGVLVLAVVVSLAAGLAVELDRFLTLGRIAGFLPFFVAGLLLGRAPLRRPAVPSARFTGVVVLLAAIPVAAVVHERIPVPFLYWDRAYSEMGYDAWSGIGVRALLLGIGAVMTWCVLVLVPRRGSWATKIGEYSMYPYLLHAFVVLWLGWAVLDGVVDQVWQLVLCLVVAVALPALIVTSPVRTVFRPLVEPRVPWLFTNESDKVSRE